VVLTKEQRAEINTDLLARYGNVVTREQLADYERETGILPNWLLTDATRVRRGIYRISETTQMAADKNTSVQTSLTEDQMLALDPQSRIDAIKREASKLATVPTNFAAFVPYGDYAAVKNIIKSRASSSRAPSRVRPATARPCRFVRRATNSVANSCAPT
jgi:hypothetical protein